MFLVKKKKNGFSYKYIFLLSEKENDKIKTERKENGGKIKLGRK